MGGGYYQQVAAYQYIQNHPEPSTHCLHTVCVTPDFDISSNTAKDFQEQNSQYVMVDNTSLAMQFVSCYVLQLGIVIHAHDLTVHNIMHIRLCYTFGFTTMEFNKSGPPSRQQLASPSKLHLCLAYFVHNHL